MVHSTAPLTRTFHANLVEHALDAYVQANASIREPDGKWHPSSIFGCARKAIYDYRGVEQTEPAGAQQQRTFWIGSRWHEFVQRAVADHAGADEVYTEVPISVPDLNIVGHADQLVRIGDQWEMEEFKSISQRGFDYARKQGDLPKADHVQQAMVYMYALRTFGSDWEIDKETGAPLEPPILPLGDKLSSVRFAYIAKDDLRIAEYVVPWDPAFEDSLKQTIESLDEYKADPISLPPRLPMNGKKKHWMCDWGKGRCPFYTRCWDVDPSEIAPDPDVF